MKRKIRLYEYDPEINRTFIPSSGYLENTVANGLEAKEYRVRTNSSGFILPFGLESNETKGSSIILGDSIAECIFLDEEYRIESILQNRNKDNLYLNHGYSGATTLDILNIIINKIVPLEPKKIFLMSGIVDGNISMKGFYHQDDETSTIVESPKSVNSINNFLQHREILLNTVFDIVKKFEIEIIIGTIGHRHNPSDPNGKFLCLPIENNIYHKINKQTLRIAMDRSIKFIDFEGLMYDHFDLHYDSYHLNKKGANLVANELLNIGF